VLSSVEAKFSPFTTNFDSIFSVRPSSITSILVTPSVLQTSVCTCQTMIVLLVVQCVSQLYIPRKQCSVLLAVRLLMQGQAIALFGDLESDLVIGRYVHINIFWTLFFCLARWMDIYLLQYSLKCETIHARAIWRRKSLSHGSNSVTFVWCMDIYCEGAGSCLSTLQVHCLAVSHSSFCVLSQYSCRWLWLCYLVITIGLAPLILTLQCWN
jgi:hypothetical protein